jgi:D-cysteine desulfhydrase family pyridoxal phosphate-dependent enzyme
MNLAKLERVRIATLPTPLQYAGRLTEALGGPKIFIKRDDLTGLALGGNKLRKLEFLLARAKAVGATCVITCGGTQSNHACQTAAAAARVGLKCVLVLASGVHNELQGNLLLDNLFGADVKLIEAPATSPDELDRAMEEVAEHLRRQGEVPYIIPLGGSSRYGAAGYVLASLELINQATELGIRPDYLYVAVGSGSTLAGLIVGAKAFSAPYRVKGVAVYRPPEEQKRAIWALAQDTAELLGLSLVIEPHDVSVYGEFLGPGYGRLTPEAREAIRLVARTEGLVLDPVYTGKAMAALIEHIRAGWVGPEETVVFLHTGGAAAIFAYSRELTD